MVVAVDAMGGDNAPAAIVEGAVMAARDYGIQTLLIGLENKIREELSRYSLEGLSIHTKNASEVVEMGDSPSRTLRQKRDSSIRVAVESLLSGEADAMVSAGNTGAVLAVSTVVLRPLPGIDRPAIAILLPTAKGPVVLLDAGANVDCRSELL
ncbi:MAG: phosphate acyltransferase, partial [Nitrospinota bacterium]|nr:phosphate acyltransferase [Nitrospinota bacterium]